MHKYSLSRGWEGGGQKECRKKQDDRESIVDREKQRWETERRGKEDMEEQLRARQTNTKLPNIHGHIKATTSHAFLCKCHIDTSPERTSNHKQQHGNKTHISTNAENVSRFHLFPPTDENQSVIFATLRCLFIFLCLFISSLCLHIFKS